MRKAIIFLGLLVILSSFVYAGTYDDLQDYINYISCENDATTDKAGNYDGTVSGTVTITTSNAVWGSKTCYFDGSSHTNITGLRYNRADMTKNMSVACWVRPNSTVSGYQMILSRYDHNIAQRSMFFGIDDGYYGGAHSPDGSSGYAFLGTLLPTADTKASIIYVHHIGNYLALWVNNSLSVNTTTAVGAHYNASLEWWFGQYQGGNRNWQGDIECAIWNRVLTPTERAWLADINNDLDAGADTSPPTISNLNCTSCNIPYGDIAEPYETEDTTPTFNFATNENAWCAIGVSDVNYTTMGASRNCTSGEGTQEHICTLTTQDKFISVGENYLYISCKDSSGNEGNVSDTSKSNSGKIRMEIVGAGEASGDARIELGITTSEIGATATIYSSQRVSARNLATNQFTGIFDKVAVNGNKRWAFNYVSSGESSITGLFNLTPVLYVLQLQNETNTTITNDVGKLINSTWP